MTFLKVLKASNVGVRGPLAFGGIFFDLPEFLRHLHTIFNRKVLQAMILQFCLNFFESFPNLGEQFLHRLVRQCYCWRVSNSVTHKHELWIWFTLSYAMMKALLRLAAVRDTKQAGELRGDTVHFIGSSSALVSMTQNGNIYRPLTQTATCLLRRYSSKHTAENS